MPSPRPAAEDGTPFVYGMVPMARASHPCTGPHCTLILPATAGPHCPTCISKRRKQQRKRIGRTGQWASGTTHRTTRTLLFPPGAPPPACVDCGADATDMDHVPPRRLLVAAGIHDPDHPRWMQPRCKRCHSKVTMTIDVPLIARLTHGADPTALCQQAIDLRNINPNHPHHPA